MSCWKVHILLSLVLMVSQMNVDAQPRPQTPQGLDEVQAGMVFTVSEGKRLIAKGVANMPIVKKALAEGTVIVTKGTTNTYVVEELLNTEVQAGSFVLGRIYPKKGGQRLPQVEPIGEVVIIKGQYNPDVSMAQALENLQPGDVVVKGANALDYSNRTAGVLIGAPDSGTTGKIMPYVIARKAHLIIPIGLEKQVSSEVLQLQAKMRQPMESLTNIPSMFLLTGHIVTEIEAIQNLAGVEAFQAAAGGIGGAEGSCWLIVRGKRSNVEKAMELAEQIHGEPTFLGRRQDNSESKNSNGIK